MNKHFRLFITSIPGIIIIAVLLSTCNHRVIDNQQLANTEFTWSPISTRPAWCVQSPWSSLIIGTPTPTPNLLTQMVPNTLPLEPTRTPYPIAHLIDLAPDLWPEDKATAFVFRCNGELDEYLVGSMEYSELLKIVDLKEGDIINIAPPASIMGNQILPKISPSYPPSTPQQPTRSITTTDIHYPTP